MRQACGITTLSATAAAMLRTLNGARCPGLLRAPSAGGSFANANSFSGGCAQSALHGAPPVRCRRRLAVIKYFWTNLKENQQMEKEHTRAEAAVPNTPTEAKCPVKVGPRRHTV